MIYVWSAYRVTVDTYHEQLFLEVSVHTGLDQMIGYVGQAHNT